MPVAPLPDDSVALPTHRHLIHPKSISFQIDNQLLALPQRDRLIIGRRGADCTLVQPDIDLTPFGAAEKGVSRQHIQLRTTAYLTYVADLNSKNGTWLNGTRILGDRLLRDGDELRLGQLTITVLFC
ncbi:MAG: FHA domain-containing protein [Anaerolineae bacterium]|nr:FHA domain-containing protein [Anaerolineae bacterium]